MVFSYSQIAAPAADTPKVISLASPLPSGSTSTINPSAAQDESPSVTSISPDLATTSASSLTPESPVASSSTSQKQPSSSSSSTPRLKHLILDAGPLLSLTPLRHLAESYHTTPAVVAELRDPKAREYWDRLALQGVDVKVQQPSPESMARVMAFARKTGDYAVLSQTDLGVVALTLQYEVMENGEENVRREPGEKKSRSNGDGPVNIQEQKQEGRAEVVDDDSSEEPISAAAGEDDLGSQLAVTHIEENSPTDSSPPNTSSTSSELPVKPFSEARSEPIDTSSPTSPPPSSLSPAQQSPPDLPEEEEDDPESDGEWITPSTLSHHRSKDLGLLPSTSKNAPQVQLAAAAMTGDFAVQNVLLAMGLGLVGEGGKRIGKVKSWVLRCHACFKICKDPSKRFCPSCGGPTLLRTNCTTTANGKTHLHLKTNYQYNLRGTKYSIPDAKMGRAKGQQKGGTGLILREDQREWSDAVRLEEGRRRKEEKRAQKGGWEDPDWLPEILTVGMSGKGRSGGQGMPTIGHGRKNPNVARRKK